MSEILDFDELEKQMSDISVISENENTFNCIIKWSTRSSDFMKTLDKLKEKKQTFQMEEIKSSWFEVGSKVCCQFLLQVSENSLSAFIIFKKGYLPSLTISSLFEKLWINGKVKLLQTEEIAFSISGKDADKPIKIVELDEVPLFYSEDAYGPMIECYMKLKFKDVKCTFDKRTVERIESRNYDLHKNSLSNLSHSDVTIQVENSVMKVHKAFLSKIPFFEQLFDEDETKQHFELKDISLISFKIVLNYLYADALPHLDFRLACELYVVASDLKIFDLKNICSSFLGANLTQENVFIVFSLSVEWDDLSLKKECIKYIQYSDCEELAQKSLVF